MSQILAEPYATAPRIDTLLSNPYASAARISQFPGLGPSLAPEIWAAPEVVGLPFSGSAQVR